MFEKIEIFENKLKIIEDLDILLRLKFIIQNLLL